MEREYILKKHWLAHTKPTCPRCHIPFKKARLGRTNRRSDFWASPETLRLGGSVARGR